MAVKTEAAKAVRVLVADSSRIHTQLLAEALKRDSALEVISWDSDARTLLTTVQSCAVEILAISCALEGQPTQGLEILRQVRSSCPQVRVVVLLDSQKPEIILDAFRSGARGVFSRDGSVEMFCKCIRSLHQGQVWAGSPEIALVLEALASTPTLRAVGANGLDILSKREMEVVRCLVQGLTNREIADRMGLSQHTVKNYLFRVFDKLGVSSRVELLFMTLSQGNQEDAAPPRPSKKSTAGSRAAGGDAGDGHPDDESTLILFQKAAEAGVPAAQMALAQAYLTRRTNPDDLVQAYMWYLVATERAIKAKELITKAMTAAQIAQAEQQASSWLSRLQKISPLT
jgi:two-component system nitrate/nitrite response regulator NarL